MDVVNHTPFAADRALFLDGTGRERLLVVVKATWSVADGAPTPAEAQVPVAVADVYRGEPERSSLLEASDLVPFKPATDVLVAGRAYTAAGRRTEAVAALQIGPLRKGVRVTGDRRWKRTLGIAGASAPEPFASLELTWERAFGGADGAGEAPDRCEDNPVGVGFRGKRCERPVDGAPLPNVEDPAAPMRSPGDRPAPAGFGPVAPHWRPRARFAGTYDETWRAERFPFLPEDFDPRFHQVAPADQILAGHLRGGERVTVAGMTPEGGLAFTLPALRPEVLVGSGGGERTLVEGACDTVLLDCERKQVTLVWRGSVDVHGRVERLEFVRVDEGKTRAG